MQCLARLKQSYLSLSIIRQIHAKSHRRRSTGTAAIVRNLVLIQQPLEQGRTPPWESSLYRDRKTLCSTSPKTHQTHVGDQVVLRSFRAGLRPSPYLRWLKITEAPEAKRIQRRRVIKPLSRGVNPSVHWRVREGRSSRDAQT